MNLKELKEKILTEINQKTIYEKYIGKQLKLSQAIKSPLRKQDRHPSFNIYEKGGQILWKDFAEENGNVIDFTMRLFSVDFKTAIQKISQDFGLESFNLKMMKPIPKFSLKDVAETTIDIKTVEKNWDAAALAYWNKFGINMFRLKGEKVNNLQEFTYQNKSGDNRIGIATSNDPIFQVLYPSGHMKIYRPKSVNKAFKWRSNVKAGIDFWGLDKLTDDDKIVIIASGIKDALCVIEHMGIRAVFPNSETSYPTEEQFKKLSKDRTVYVFFDNDETGRKQALKMVERFNVIDLGDCLFEKFKDIAEYYHFKIMYNHDTDPLRERILKKINEKDTNTITD